MIKTKIKFEEIAAGDLLEVVGNEFGVKSVYTGIAFEKVGSARTGYMWDTSQGGTIVGNWEEDTIYRIDVKEARFEDIQWGDYIECSGKRGDVERIFRGRVVDFRRSDASWYDGWATDDGTVMVRRRDEVTIKILERGA